MNIYQSVVTFMKRPAFAALVVAAMWVNLVATAQAQEYDYLPEHEYYGYKVVHHMGVVAKHLEQHGFNTFSHEPISDYRSFVITPALDHFYSKAVGDLRWGPVVVDIGERDDRYASIQIVDQEHYSIFEQKTVKEGERFIVIREDYKGILPKGTVIRTKSSFPFIFVRTQTLAYNDDQLSDSIRRSARVNGVSAPVDLPSTADTQALIQWSIDNSISYPESKATMKKAAATYTPEVHQATRKNLITYIQSGALKGNPGMFEPLGDPAGGPPVVRAAGTLLGHLGFPVRHAYYQNVNVDGNGIPLKGANGPFVVKLPYDPGVKDFWSITRYGADTFLPLNPADIGGNDIQAYTTFNIKPDANGDVSFTFSTEDPKDGTYWMPVKDDGYYFIVRYYPSSPNLNGQTAFDRIYAGTKMEDKIKPLKF